MASEIEPLESELRPTGHHPMCIPSLLQARPSQPCDCISLSPSSRRQPSHRLLKALRLPLQRYLIDVLPPERHRLSIRQANPIFRTVGVLTNAPKSTIFDLRDAEVECFGVAVGVLDDGAYDATGEEVGGDLAGEDGAVPVGGCVLADGMESTWHWPLRNQSAADTINVYEVMHSKEGAL